MSIHRWRQGHGIDPLREFLRRKAPSGPEGFVASDLDLIIRRFGFRFDLDSIGDLMLLEKKQATGALGEGQRRIFSTIDQAFKESTLKDRWRGCHLVNMNEADHPQTCPVCGAPNLTADEAYEYANKSVLQFDGKAVSHEQFLAIVTGKIDWDLGI